MNFTQIEFKTKLKKFSLILLVIATIFFFSPKTVSASSDYTYGWTKTIGNDLSNNGGNFIGSDGLAVAHDSNNNIYTFGFFSGTFNFDPTGGMDSKTSHNNSNFGYDIFLTKTNADGSYAWTYTVGGTDRVDASSIDVDSNNNVYLSGSFLGTANFDPTGGIDNKTAVSESNGDVFLTKINANNSYGWTDVMNSADNNSWNVMPRITHDTANNIYLTGSFFGTVNFDPTGGMDSKTTSGGAFLTKINANNSYGWTDIIADGNYSDYSVKVDTSGNIFWAGNFVDPVDFDPTSGVNNKECANDGSGDVCMFLTKINSDNSYAWTDTTTNVDDGNYNKIGVKGLAIDSSNNIYLAGCFVRTINFNFTGGGSADTINGGYYTIFLTKINSDGSYGWTKTIFGGVHGVCADMVALDSSQNIYISGQYCGTSDFDPGPGVDNHTDNASGSTYLTQIKPDGSYGWTDVMVNTGVFGTGSANASRAITIDTADNIYLTGFFIWGTVNFNTTGGVDNRTSVDAWGGYFLTKLSAPEITTPTPQPTPTPTPTTNNNNGLTILPQTGANLLTGQLQSIFGLFLF
jgi:hypothetical protein